MTAGALLSMPAVRAQTSTELASRFDGLNPNPQGAESAPL
jgi:hypothetical protein